MTLEGGRRGHTLHAIPDMRLDPRIGLDGNHAAGPGQAPRDGTMPMQAIRRPPASGSMHIEIRDPEPSQLYSELPIAS